MIPREPKLIGKSFLKENKPLNGRYVYKTPNPNHPTGWTKTVYFFKNGKLHGTPAMIYPDGREEDWDNGNFIKISFMP